MFEVAPVSRRLFHALKKLACFSWIVARAKADFFVNLWLTGKASSFKARADWLHRWSIRTLRCLNVVVERIGERILQRRKADHAV